MYRCFAISGFFFSKKNKYAGFFDVFLDIKNFLITN